MALKLPLLILTTDYLTYYLNPFFVSVYQQLPQLSSDKPTAQRQAQPDKVRSGKEPEECMFAQYRITVTNEWLVLLCIYTFTLKLTICLKLSLVFPTVP